MIGKIKGIVDSIGDDHVIIDVNGVGYLIYISARTLQLLPSLGEKVVFFIETIVREDMIRLFGFMNKDEQQWFNLLLNVQGVGQKVALAILSTLSYLELARAIAEKNKAMIARSNGVGPKLAERICIELKDKIPTSLTISASGGGNINADIYALDNAIIPIRDAISALQNLGYNQIQATNAINAAYEKLGEGAETGALIRQGLKELTR